MIKTICVKVVYQPTRFDRTLVERIMRFHLRKAQTPTSSLCYLSGPFLWHSVHMKGITNELTRFWPQWNKRHRYTVLCTSHCRPRHQMITIKSLTKSCSVLEWIRPVHEQQPCRRLPVILLRNKIVISRRLGLKKMSPKVIRTCYLMIHNKCFPFSIIFIVHTWYDLITTRTG